MERYRFFDSIDGEDERYYSADEFAEYFRQLITSGIFNGGENLQVICNGTDMQVQIKEGYAWIEGYLYKIDTELLALTLDTADPALDRIDRVVIRLDKRLGNRYVKAFILKGEPAAEPVAPELTRDENIYELALAQVLVIAGKSHIEGGEIADERLNTEVCGLANSLVTADTTDIFNQFQGWLDSKTAEPGGEFYKEWKGWFDEIQDTTNLVTKSQFDEYVANNVNDIRDINDKLFVPTMEVETLNATTDKSVFQNGSPMTIALNTGYVFIEGSLKELWKLNKSTLQKVGSTQVLAGSIVGSVADDEFVYILCSDSICRKINVETMQVVATVAGAASKCIVEEGDFLYVKTGQQIIEKKDKDTLTTQCSYKNQVSGVDFNAVAIHGDYVYVAETRDNTSGRYTKLYKSNLQVVHFKTATMRIMHICVSEDGLYTYENWVSADTPYKSHICKRDTDTGIAIRMVVISTEVHDMTLKDGGLYIVQGYTGETPNTSYVSKYDLDLNFIAGSRQDTTSFGGIKVDYAHVYNITGNKIERVSRQQHEYYDGETIKSDILASSIDVQYKIKYLRGVGA